ncbi:hypothetical protein SNE25_11660 [Mucilaginibacter sabulilitoris]|uniref:Uncharacterized protein n=1 Tax=Mucilaginibacter sabulilitoris TaxID=1173583 RepID=A0ABZ0TT99_9SPHI|nr:hypothetical protein [Mucilaginibacter sabulilitoris]WPU96174.1 hypothetical protein SNE25_11660 [Mucilaginibacter sabulilitoris]
MKLDELKYAWGKIETPVKSTDDIRLMLSENRHPVLKKIRKQLTIEMIGWSVFFICYYTMFDGDQKPVWINLTLIVSVLLPLIHNLMGYRFSKYLVNGNTINESLKNYLSKVKVYATVSIICRFFFATGLLVFFTYGLSFNTKKYISLGVIILIFLIQLSILYRLWAKRLKKLENAVTVFN